MSNIKIKDYEERIIYADINNFKNYNSSYDIEIIIVFIITLLLIIIASQIPNIIISYYILILAFYIISPYASVALATILIFALYYDKFEYIQYLIIIPCIISLLITSPNASLIVNILILVAFTIILQLQQLYLFKIKDTQYIIDNLFDTFIPV